jgi:hypothetical protein
MARLSTGWNRSVTSNTGSDYASHLAPARNMPCQARFRMTWVASSPAAVWTGLKPSFGK